MSPARLHSDKVLDQQCIVIVRVIVLVLEYYSISIRIGSSISISIRLPRSGDLRCTVKGTPERCGCEDGVFVGGEADRGSPF